MGLSCHELHMRSVVKEKFGRTLTIGRTANLTKGQNGPRAVPLLRAL